MEQLIHTVAYIRELEEQIANLTAELEHFKGEVKDFMKTNSVKSIDAGKYRVTYSEYTSNRFDSKTFKAEHEDLYTAYLKATPATRLTISLKK